MDTLSSSLTSSSLLTSTGNVGGSPCPLSPFISCRCETKSKTNLIDSVCTQSVPFWQGGFQDLPLSLVVTPSPPCPYLCFPSHKLFRFLDRWDLSSLGLPPGAGSQVQWETNLKLRDLIVWSTLGSTGTHILGRDTPGIFFYFLPENLFIIFQEIKRELNRILIYECRCDERLITPCIHCTVWETGTPKDRDEVKRREVWECEGWVWSRTYTCTPIFESMSTLELCLVGNTPNVFIMKR